MSPQSKPHLQDILSRKGASASEVHKRPVSTGVRNTPSLKKDIFSQKPSNAPSEMLFHKGDKG